MTMPARGEESIEAICGRMLPPNGAVVVSTFNSSSTTKDYSHKISCESDFHTSDEALAAGLTLGFPLYGIPLKLGLSFSDDKKEQWKHANCTDDLRNGSQSRDISQFTQTASATLTDGYVKCVIGVAKTRPTGIGLKCGFSDAGETGIILSARFFTDSLSHPRVHVSQLQLSPSLHCQGDWNPRGSRAQEQTEVSPGAIGMICSRSSRAQTAFAIINTDTAGSCQAQLDSCGAFGMTPCDRPPLCAGDLTVLDDNTCGEPCGRAGQKCCSNGCKESGLSCSSNQCVACGHMGQQCCMGNACSEGSCVAGACQNPKTITEFDVHIVTWDDDKDKSMQERWDVYIEGVHAATLGPYGDGVRWADKTDNGRFAVASQGSFEEGKPVKVDIQQIGNTGWRMAYSDIEVRTVGNPNLHVLVHCPYHQFEGNTTTSCSAP